MIRTEAIVNYGGLDRMSAIARTMPQAPIVIGQNVLKKYERPILDELSYTPPRFTGKRIWTSEKQRHYVMWLLRSTNNLPYHRTGKLSSSWKITLVTAPGGMAIRVENPTKYAAFVVGRLRPRGANPMQAMHVQGGWQPVSKTIEFWSAALAEETQKELRAWLDSVK